MYCRLHPPAWGCLILYIYVLICHSTAAGSFVAFSSLANKRIFPLSTGSFSSSGLSPSSASTTFSTSSSTEYKTNVNVHVPWYKKITDIHWKNEFISRILARHVSDSVHHTLERYLVSESVNLVVVPDNEKSFQSFPSVFGPPPPQGRVKGALYPITIWGENIDMQACPRRNRIIPSAYANATGGPRFKWAALVQRGGCSFLEKVKTSQQLGASAVIIGDYASSSKSSNIILPSSSEDTSLIHIPSVIVSHEAMTEMLKMFWLSQDPGSSSYHELIAYSEAVETPSNLLGVHNFSKRRSSKFLGTQVFVYKSICTTGYILDTLVLIIMFTCSYIVYCRQAREDRSSVKSRVNNLPVSIWKRPALSTMSFFKPSSPTSCGSPGSLYLKPICTEGLNTEKSPLVSPISPVGGDMEYTSACGNRSCSICMSDFDLGDYITELPCGHYFHAHEISTWLLQHQGSCPLCRARI